MTKQPKHWQWILMAALGSGSLVAGFCFVPLAVPRVVAAPLVARSGMTWQVTPHASGPWAIGYGSNGVFPQFAALDPLSGYLRLVCQTTWGTSIVLPPCFWSHDYLTQGMPITATYHVDGDNLVIDATGSRDGLTATLEIKISPPTATGITAEVTGKCAGDITLNNRPGEAFKTVMLSSMRVTAEGTDSVAKQWDSSSILIDSDTPVKFDDCPRPSAFFVDVSPKQMATRFGFTGGKSLWQTGDPAPSVVIQLDNPTQIAGFRTMDPNPNDDNLGFWAGSDIVVKSWHYTVTASKP